MKKVKIGVIGTGKLGRKHINNLAHKIPNADLIALCSLDQDVLLELKQHCNVKDIYTDVNDMLKNKDLEAAAIISPASEHLEHIKLVTEKKLHIFCEKPLGMNLKECNEAVEFAKKNNKKIFMVGLQRRFDPSMAYAKDLIETGNIGKPYMIRSYGLDPVYTVDIAIPYAAQSGGIFIDMTIHDIDLAHWFMGSKIRSVYAMGGNYVEKRFAEHNDIDSGSAIARFENEGLAYFYTSRVVTHGYHIEIDILGTKGMLRIGGEPVKNLCTIFNEHGIVKETPYWFQERFEESYRLEMQAFIDSIQKNEASPISIYEGYDDTVVAYAMKKSWQKDNIIKL